MKGAAYRMSRRENRSFRCSATGCELKTEDEAENGDGERNGSTVGIGANKTDPRSGYRKYQIMRTAGEIGAAYYPMCE